MRLLKFYHPFPQLTCGKQRFHHLPLQKLSFKADCNQSMTEEAAFQKHEHSVGNLQSFCNVKVHINTAATI
jgi:hypothetical protein